MPRRDPETGKFVQGGSDDFDRFEEAYSTQNMTVAAADLSGGTGEQWGEDTSFENVDIYGVHEILDRDELGVLVWAEHYLAAYAKSTMTADSTVRAAVQISTSPDRESGVAEGTGPEGSDISETTGDFPIQLDPAFAVDNNTIGRGLHSVGFGPGSDGASGVGVGGSVQADWWEGNPWANPVFDDRSTIFMNGVIEQNNISDGSISVDVATRHVYGVLED